MTLSQTNSADLDQLLRSGLRAQIGDQRYSMWFSRDVRFVFDGTVVTVSVEKEFQLSWLRDTFSHMIEMVARELLGPSATVKFALEPTAPSSSTHAAPSATFLPFPPPTSSPAPTTLDATPVKRRRGRPRKSETATAQDAASVETPSASAFASTARATERIFTANELPRADLSAHAAPDSLLERPPVEPAKRKRGRPRKNATPNGVASQSTNGAASSSVDESRGAPDALPPPSFVDLFANVAQREHTSPALASASSLSEQERVALAVGSFDDDPRLNPPPRRRGRPSGGAKNADLFADAIPEVSRDENGLNVVRLPKETRRVKLDESGRRFATLGSFVQGFSNSVAYKTIEIAILQPGTMNPITISGSTSVGKTHLLEAACDSYARKWDAKSPLYMTAEQFTTLFIQSLRGGSPFRDRFKNISLFALDDVHFLEGKISTQTELLNILDFLRARNVQTLFSANRPLRELTKLRSELLTRLQSGMTCTIEQPERETLAQIFRRMALERRLAVPDDVCRYVVSRYATHARELSGALNRLFAAHLTTGAPITVELARTALSDLATVATRSVKLEDVERVVQETFGLEQKALKSSSRAKKCADPRALAMWLARKYTRAALTEIGEFFGGRRHSAVISAQKKVDRWLEEHEAIASPSGVFTVQETLERLERSLGVARV